MQSLANTVVVVIVSALGLTYIVVFGGRERGGSRVIVQT